MNLIQNAIQSVKDKIPESPRAGLVYANIILRGGRSTREEIENDANLWELRHGDATWERLEAWSAELDIEAGIAGAACKAMLGSPECAASVER